MNFIISVICSLLLGYLCATFLFQSQRSTSTTFQDTNRVYFLQYSAPVGKEEAQIPYTHLLVEEGGQDHIYIGMTTSQDNAKKVQHEYQNLGVELSIREGKVASEEFVSELVQYDILLKSTKTSEEMNSVLATILSSYEEFVLHQ